MGRVGIVEGIKGYGGSSIPIFPSIVITALQRPRMPYRSSVRNLPVCELKKQLKTLKIEFKMSKISLRGSAPHPAGGSAPRPPS